MNFSLQQKMLFSVLSFFATQLYSMEITEVPAKPTLMAQIFVDHRDRSAYYSAQGYHDKLTDMGVPSCIQNPLVAVIIIGKGKQGNVADWTKNPPFPITNYEIGQCEAQQIPVDEDKIDEICRKILPHTIPALCLYKAKTGTILSFNMYGYPVELTCCDNLQTKESFEAGYLRCMDAFTQKPTCFHHDFIIPLKELVEHELLEETEDKNTRLHGKKGFVSIEKLIIELMEKNGSGSSKFLLLLPFFKYE